MAMKDGRIEVGKMVERYFVVWKLSLMLQELGEKGSSSTTGQAFYMRDSAVSDPFLVP